MAGRFLRSWVRYEPPSEVPYPQSLRMSDSRFAGVRQIFLGIGGAMLGLFLLYWVPGLIAALVLQVTYLASGSPGDWLAYATAARVFAIPAGMFATHLGAGSMILVSLGLVVVIHRFHPHWLHSVQPGFRWRYAFAAFLVAAVVLGGVWALSRIGQSWAPNPEPQWGWYLVAVLLTTPLQAAGEEYFFRGYLMQAISLTAADAHRKEAPAGKWTRTADWMARQYPTWAGVIGSALVFALVHPIPNLEAFIYPLAFGLVSGWLVVKTGGLEASIAAHVVNNLIVYGFATYSGTVVKVYTDRAIEWPALILAILSFAGFAAAAWWVGRKMKLATLTPESGLIASPRLR